MFDKINSNLRAFNYFQFHLSFKMFQLLDFPPLRSNGVAGAEWQQECFKHFWVT